MSQLASLGSLVAKNAPIIYGILMPGDDVQGGVPVVKVRNFEDGMLNVSNLLRTSPEIDAQYRRSRLRAGDILLSIRGTTGLVAVVPPEVDGGNITQDSARIRIENHALRDFIVHALASPFVQRQVALHTVGQAVKGINIASVRDLQIPLPLDLRHRELLTRLFSSVQRVEHLVGSELEAKRRLKRALLQQLFGPGARGRVVTLADVVRLRSGNTPSKERADYWGGTFPWISAKDLKRPRIGESIDRITELAVRESATVVPPGTTVILVRGMMLLKDVPVAIATRELAINQDLKGLEPTGLVDPAFLLCALSAKRQQLMGFVNRAGHGTGKLDTDRLLSLPLRLPPMNEQQRMSASVEHVDYEIALLERQLAAYRRLKRGLMQKLLTGEIEVSNQ